MKWYSKEIWCNKEGWKFIFINFVGNLFPVWFLLIIEFGNNGFSLEGLVKNIAQPYTYLILSVALASSTLYLWIKSIKSEGQQNGDAIKKVSIGMILYIIILFPIIGFYLNKKDCLEKYRFEFSSAEQTPKKMNKCLSYYTDSASVNNSKSIGTIKKDDCSKIIPIIYFISFLVTAVYIYYQLYDFYEMRKMEERANQNPAGIVNNEIQDLNQQL